MKIVKRLISKIIIAGNLCFIDIYRTPSMSFVYEILLHIISRHCFYFFACIIIMVGIFVLLQTNVLYDIYTLVFIIVVYVYLN